MLRITINDQPRFLLFQLEGRLAGPAVQELEEHLKRIRASPSASNLRVDLTGVTFIDRAGKACLTALHGQGADFVSPDCLTKGIVEEIGRGHITRPAEHSFKENPMTSDADNLREEGRAAESLKKATQHLDEEQRLLETLEARIQNAERKRKQTFDPSS
jgi:hypothetical protein